MRLNAKRLTIVCGLVGPLILTAGTAWTALHYRGKEAEVYSPLNHFISQLGEAKVSNQAAVFNACLIAGGIILVGFNLGLGIYLGNYWSYAAAIVGIWAALSTSAIGLVPMDNLVPHVWAAYSFFYGGMGAVALFLVANIRAPRGRAAKWLIVPGAISLACFVAFLWYTRGLTIEELDSYNSLNFIRPNVWTITVLEWLVFVSVMLWILLASVDLLFKSGSQAKQ